VVCVLLVLGLVGLTYSFGTLYGLDSHLARVIKINPQNAQESPIGRYAYPKELLARQVSSIDVERKIYYFIAYNTTAKAIHLVGLSLKSGVLISSIKLPYAETAHVGLGEYCAVIPKTGQVLTLGKDRVRPRYHILEVNTTSGKIQVIGSLEVKSNVIAGAAAFDPERELFFFQMGTETEVNNYAYSVPQRKQVLNATNVDNIETMNWDSKTKRIVGIGFVSGSRALISLDTVNGHSTVIARIPHYFVIDAQLAALDEERRIIYSYLQPANPTHAPFHLVGLDVDSGHLVTSPEAGESHRIPCSIAFDSTL